MLFQNGVEKVLVSLGFRLFILGKNQCDVEVIEVEEIDFDVVKRGLENGKQVFLTTVEGAN